jgi:RNA recognition motif-containing protein
MAKVWIGNLAPDVTDDELRALLKKYGFPEPGDITRVGADGPRPAATVDFPAQISSDLTGLATRLHDLYWRGRRLNVQAM